MVTCTVGELSRPATLKLMQRLASWLPQATLEIVSGAAHDVALDGAASTARHVLTLAAGRVENADPSIAVGALPNRKAAPVLL